MLRRRSFLSLTTLTVAFVSIPITWAAKNAANVSLDSGAPEMRVPVAEAVIGKYLRVETDAYWTKGGEKKGSPPDGPTTVTVGIEWQDRSGDWTVLEHIEAPLNGQMVLAAELTKGTATEKTYVIHVLGKPPEGYELNVDLRWEVTDKQQELEE